MSRSSGSSTASPSSPACTSSTPAARRSSTPTSSSWSATPRRNRFPERWIVTNGYLLSERLVDRLGEAGLTHLQLSVDGVTPNPTTVKVLRPLRKKLELLATRARFRVQVNAVLGAATTGEALEVVRAAKDLGFRPRVSILHDGDGAMALDERARAELAELVRAIGRRFSEAHDYRARLVARGEADFRCRAGARYLYIDEHGLVNWCSQQRGVFTKPILEYGWGICASSS